MKGKLFGAVLICVLLAGCSAAGQTNTAETTIEETISEETTAEQTDNAETENYISFSQAYEIAKDYWNIEPGTIDEKTGNRIDIMYPAEHKDYQRWYTFSLMWLVDNDHYSSIDDSIYISGTDGTVTKEKPQDYEESIQ